MHKLFKLLPLLSLFILLAPGCQDDDNGDGGMTGGNDTLPNLIVDVTDVTVAEGDYEWATAILSLSLDAPSVGSTSVQVSTADVTATSGEDFKRINNRVFFDASGQATVSILVYGDLHREEDETFTITFSGGNNLEANDESVTVTITNNDDSDNPFSIPPTGADVPSEYDGYNLVWSDEFDDPQSLTENYVHDLGSMFNGWGNNELQYYQQENVTIGDGHLIITAKEENRSGFNYTSTRIKTKDVFEFTHGRVDVRASLPEGQGVWPAIWMLGANIDEVGWPRCGEIDIMEMLGHQPNKLHGTVHFSDASGNYGNRGSDVDVPQGLNRTFNVFSIIWTSQSIEWRLNDVPYHTVQRSALGSAWVFDQPQFFLFNVAVGGNWPGSPDGTTQFPQRMIIDYVRVYQQ